MGDVDGDPKVGECVVGEPVRMVGVGAKVGSVGDCDPAKVGELLGEGVGASLVGFGVTGDMVGETDGSLVSYSGSGGKVKTMYVGDLLGERS